MIKNIFKQIINYFKVYISLSFWFLLFIVCIRFYEVLLLTYYNGSFLYYVKINIWGLFFDTILFLKTCCFSLPIFLILFHFFPKITNIFFKIIGALALFLSFICVTYFIVSGSFLDVGVFAYSFQEMIEIIKVSTNVPLWCYIVIIILPILFIYTSKKQLKFPKVFYILFIILLPVSMFINNNTNEKELTFYIKTNKGLFFIKSFFSQSNNIDYTDKVELVKAIKEFQSYFPQYDFVSKKHPFLHKAEYADVLSPFFNLNPTPPNFVFIIVEGLSMEVMDSNYSIMPFLDSISHHSLLWEQCYSITARTYGVIPAIFGALPVGEKGFMSLSPYTPEYTSLLKIMSKNGYNNNFYCGGFDFDNISNFMKENNTQLGIKDFDEDIEKQSKYKAWGKEDHLSFMQAVRNIDFNQKPRVDIYLTLTSHDPWEYPNKEYYQSVFENKILSIDNIQNANKKYLLDNKKILASYMYVDMAIKQLIQAYSQKVGFENTIFIITGDHSPFSNQLRGKINFHVPLFIWSPMLKSPKLIKGLANHHNITPTILSLLRSNYNMEVPSEVSWLSNSIDTSNVYNTSTFAPLYSASREIVGIIFNDYLLCDDELLHFDNRGNFSLENNFKKKAYLKRIMDLHVALEKYAIKNDALIKTSKNIFFYNKLIIDQNDTISKNSFFANKLGLKVRKTLDNNSEALYFNNTNEFIEFFSYTIENENTFKFEIDFDLYVDNDELNNIYVCHSFEKNNPTYFSDLYSNECFNKWMHYQHSYTLYKDREKYKKGDRYVMYLWNPSFVNGYIDNIKIKCVAHN